MVSSKPSCLYWQWGCRREIIAAQHPVVTEPLSLDPLTLDSLVVLPFCASRLNCFLCTQLLLCRKYSTVLFQLLNENHILEWPA